MPETMTEQLPSPAQSIIAAHTPAEIPVLAELKPLEQRVLLLASYGGTAKEVAQYARARRHAVERTRDNLIEAFGVPNMAAVVNAALWHRQLPFEVDDSSPIPARLGERERLALGYIAIGFTKGQIAAQFGKNPDTFHANVLRPSFKILGSSGRTHSVRRSYEIGIFKARQEA